MDSTYVEINLDNLKNNVNTIIKKYNNYDYYIGVLKGNAYGHGEYIVNELVESGINYIAVATIKEALNIRKYNKSIPVLLLEPIEVNDLDIALKNNLTLTIHSLDYLDSVISLIDKKVKVHIKIDSGMGRLGINNKNELNQVFSLLKNNENILVEGIYTHFATIGIFDNKWDNQLSSFKLITNDIDLKKIPIIHMGSSITLLSHPKIDICNGIRMGTILYGYNISYKLDNKGIKNIIKGIRNKYVQKKYNISNTFINVDIDLKPAMSFYTNILQIKKINKGEKVGYGNDVELNDDSLIAVIPVGYNNGLGTKNNNSFVFINNKKYYILVKGMNMSIILIDNKVNINDKVIILDNKNITIGMLGRFADRTFHEMLLNIGKNNIKKYLKNNKIIYEEK